MSKSKDQLTKSVLESTKIRRPWLRLSRHPGSIFFFVVLGLGGYALLVFLPYIVPGKPAAAGVGRVKSSEAPMEAGARQGALSDDVAKVLAALGAVGIFLIGYSQWYAARREQSLEKFYEKLKDANQYINTYEVERLKNDPERRLEHLLNMRVFFQLDNLEYILEKYRRGYVDDDVLDRAVGTFRAECKDGSFIQQLLRCIGRNDEDQRAEGTPKYVRDAARSIALQFESTAGYATLLEPRNESTPLRVEIMGEAPSLGLRPPDIRRN